MYSKNSRLEINPYFWFMIFNFLSLSISIRVDTKKNVLVEEVSYRFALGSSLNGDIKDFWWIFIDLAAQ